MGDIRARDADRDRYVEVLEAAYADGQLGAEDRELRVASALQAETLAELDMITRDLQGRPRASAVPAQVHVAGARPVAPRRRSGVPWIVGAVLGLVGLGVPVLAFVAPSPDAGSSSGVVRVETPVETGEQPVGEKPDPFEVSPADVRAFLRSYEAEFATLETYDAVLHPTRVSVEVPVRRSRPRAERWSYDGAWQRDATTTAAVPPGGTVDLGALDVRRLFANIAKAERTLGVERARLTHVSVRRSTAGVPTVNIYVGNRFGESAYLMTALSGETLRSFPYSP